MVRWPRLPRSPFAGVVTHLHCPPFLKDCRAAMTTALIALGSYLAAFVLFLHWWARFPR
jgi:hypothetical protein